jgi:hypothetical protein
MQQGGSTADPADGAAEWKAESTGGNASGWDAARGDATGRDAACWDSRSGDASCGEHTAAVDTAGDEAAAVEQGPRLGPSGPFSSSKRRFVQGGCGQCIYLILKTIFLF